MYLAAGWRLCLSLSASCCLFLFLVHVSLCRPCCFLSASFTSVMLGEQQQQQQAAVGSAAVSSLSVSFSVSKERSLTDTGGAPGAPSVC